MSFFGSLWNALTTARQIAANLLFLLLLIILLLFLFGGSAGPTLPTRFALHLDLSGALVERATPLDPVARLLGRGAPGETVMADAERLLAAAAQDDRVAALVLNTTELTAINLVQIERLGQALNDFKASGKPVLTHAAYYSQPQYLLASYADALYLHPMGEALLTGLGSYQPYYAGLLEKLNIDVHVFRVGKFKAAVEPYLRDSISPEAAAASSDLLGNLWSSFRAQIATNRGIDESMVDGFVNGLAVAVEAADGDLARLAVESRLVDELLTPDAFEARIADELGVAVDELEQIDSRTYVADVGPDPSSRAVLDEPGIGLISGAGPISGASLSQMATGIIADPFIELIRTAKDDDNVRALVVHVDSPGGEVIASERIRRELELVQLAGKPVVIAMGGTAASGGYWISATADKIYASSDTITGSIGIFGVLPTVNKALNNLGVTIDGVGTHALAGGASITRPLTPEMSGIIQASVDQGYDRFITLVARGRDLERQQVEDIAQGRVWSGQQALELGLVDELGTLADALDSAAQLAGLAGDYPVRRIEPVLTPRELLLRQLSGASAAQALLSSLGLDNFAQTAQLQRAAGQVPALARWLTNLPSLNGPRELALCQSCELSW